MAQLASTKIYGYLDVSNELIVKGVTVDGMRVEYVSSNYSIPDNCKNILVAVNTTSAAVTVTLPSAPADGTIVRVHDVASNFASNQCTVSRNGKTIMGLAENMNITTTHATATLIYINNDWRVIG